MLIDSLGVKFGGRDEAEIADVYALPADEVVRRTFADLANAPDYDQMSEAQVEEVARDREAAVLYGWRPYMHNPSLRHWLHRIKIPTLVLWGERDGDHCPRLWRAAGAGDPRRAVFDDCRGRPLPADRAAGSGGRCNCELRRFALMLRFIASRRKPGPTDVRLSCSRHRRASMEATSERLSGPRLVPGSAGVVNEAPV